MDRVLAGRRLQLTYVRDRLLIDNLRRGGPVDNRLELGLPAGILGWAVRANNSGFNHLLLATDRWTGACEGLITAADHAIGQDSFLLLDTALFAPGADRLVLPRRMLALMLARAFSNKAAPSAVAVRTRSLGLCEAMRAVARRTPGAVLYPEPEAGAIPLATAALAHRVARSLGEAPTFDAAIAFPPMQHPAVNGGAGGDAAARTLVFLDFRAADRDAVLDCARWLYRVRMPGLPPLLLARRELSQAI